MTIHLLSDQTAAKASSLSGCSSNFVGTRRSADSAAVHLQAVSRMLPGLLLTALLVAGCATGYPVNEQRFDQSIAYANLPKSIAILPFTNQTQNPEIADIMRIIFYCHLSVYPFQDIELHIVDEKLRSLGYEDAAQIQNHSPQDLGRLLGADAVILGEITQFDRIFVGVYSQLSLGASISVVDTRNGRTIWQDSYTTRIHEGGFPLTLFEIPFVTIRSGLNLTDSVKIRAADSVSRNLAMRMPAPHIPNYSNKMAATCPVPITDYLLHPKGDVSTDESSVVK